MQNAKNVDIIERLHLRFLKYILYLKSSTSNFNCALRNLTLSSLHRYFYKNKIILGKIDI